MAGLRFFCLGRVAELVVCYKSSSNLNKEVVDPFFPNISLLGRRWVAQHCLSLNLFLTLMSSRSSILKFASGGLQVDIRSSGSCTSVVILSPRRFTRGSSCTMETLSRHLQDATNIVCDWLVSVGVKWDYPWDTGWNPCL